MKAHSFEECVSIMAHSTCTWHIYGSIFAYLFMCFVCQNVITQSNQRPWYETLPAVAMDYKVHIDAGKEDCYFQYVQPGASLYVSFQVNYGFSWNIHATLSWIGLCLPLKNVYFGSRESCMCSK